MQTKKIEIDLGFVILSTVFVASLVIASVLAAKIIQVWAFFVPAGILAYSLTFLCTDVVSEVYGKEASRKVVLSGFIGLIATFLLTILALNWSAAPFWENQESFDSILGSTTRIIIASLIAYLVSQYTDVWIFSKVKTITEGRFLWLRNNLSTAISQLIDSVIFITIAFYGVMPLFELVVGQWVIKLLIAVLDTPIAYFLVSMLRRSEKKNQVKN
jgi:queuosine precursor transporter